MEGGREREREGREGGGDLDGPLPLEEERVLLPQRANLQTRPRRGVAKTLAVAGVLPPRRGSAEAPGSKQRS